MDAAPILEKIATIFAQYNLNAIMIGNAAAALNGAPVTTEAGGTFTQKSRQTQKHERKIVVIYVNSDRYIMTAK